MKNIFLLYIFSLSLEYTLLAQAPDTLWTKVYGGSNADYAYSIQQTSDDGYIIIGRTSSFGAGGIDAWLLKTDVIGDILWTKTIGGSGDDRGRSIQHTVDGGYIIAGWTSSFGAGYSDVWLIKTAPDPSNMEQNIDMIPLDFSLDQNFPNPFNPTTRIKYGIPERTFVELRIYDILGREIEMLVNEEQEAGYYEINFNAAKLSSGIYFYRIQALPIGRQAGAFIHAKKMILIK
jgi:hypothetical protein